MLQREQLKEWAQSPVNDALVKLIIQYIEKLNAEKGVESYVQHEPQKTQENLASLSGELAAWADIIPVLQGDIEVLEEEDE